MVGPLTRGAWGLALVVTTCALYVGALLTAAAVGRRVPASHRPATKPRQALLWSENFRGPAGAPPNPRRWTIATGGSGWGNEELEYYTGRPRNVELDGHGDLVITALAETYTGGDGVTRAYTSARIQTAGLFSATYGRIEARIEIPTGRGLWPAFWALGTDIAKMGWPACGEIDIMESLGSDPFTVYGSIHGPQTGEPKGYLLSTAKRAARSLAEGFHTYGVIWSPRAIVFTLDGIPYGRETPASLGRGESWVFDKPFFLLLDLAAGGDWPGAPNATTHLPAQMIVEWVRVYS